MVGFTAGLTGPRQLDLPVNAYLSRNGNKRIGAGELIKLVRPRRAWRVEQSLVGPPEKIRIPQDEHRFEYVGHLADGRQFMAFVTGAFPDGVKLNWDTDEWRNVKSWSAVLHLFDAEGNHLSSEARLGGYDVEGRDVAVDKAWSNLENMLAQLGPGRRELGEIWVRQFSATLDGVTHSLLYEAFNGEEEEECPVCGVGRAPPTRHHVPPAVGQRRVLDVTPGLPRSPRVS